MQYYYVCKRKLWLFSKGIQLESESDRVLQGSLIHETSYPRLQKRNVTINDTISFDILKNEIVMEIKISSKMEKADEMQIGYYLYYLKQLGVEKKGIIAYPKEKLRKEVLLTKKMEDEIKNTLEDIEKIKQLDKPPAAIRKGICKRCAYYEFCFAGEPKD